MGTYAICSSATNEVTSVINGPEVPVAAPGTFIVQVEDGFDGAGKKWQGSDFVTDQVTHLVPPALLAAQARLHRSYLLSSCDWTQLGDRALTAAKLAEWRAYRQALRDVPSQPGFPDAVTWPAPPT